jgi:hypothetical protein
MQHENRYQTVSAEFGYRITGESMRILIFKILESCCCLY